MLKNMKPVIGIVGSSFSQGGQPYTKRYKNKNGSAFTLPFENHLNKYYPDIKFINVAKSGKGSERYVHNIIHLKEHFNVTHLLLENIEDRTLNHIQTETKKCKEFLEEISQDKSRWKEVAKDFSLGDPFLGQLIGRDIKTFDASDTALEGVTTKRLKHYFSVIDYHFHADKSAKLYGLRNVENTVKLCKLLGIRPIHWSHRSHPVFRNDFGMGVLKFMSTWKRQFSTYSCDGTHCNDYAVDKLSQEYFKVIIDRAL